MSSAVAHPGSSPPGLLAQALIVGSAMLAMSVALFLVLASSSDPSKPRALIFAPWTRGGDAMAAALRAGHRPMRPGVAANVVVVAPRSAGDLAVAWPAGAWFIVNLDGLFGCLDAKPEAA